MTQPTEPLTEGSAQVISQPEEATLDTEILPGYTRRELDATKYNFICRELAFGQCSTLVTPFTPSNMKYYTLNILGKPSGKAERKIKH